VGDSGGVKADWSSAHRTFGETASAGPGPGRPCGPGEGLPVVHVAGLTDEGHRQFRQHMARPLQILPRHRINRSTPMLSARIDAKPSLVKATGKGVSAGRVPRGVPSASNTSMAASEDGMAPLRAHTRPSSDRKRVEIAGTRSTTTSRRPESHPRCPRPPHRRWGPRPPLVPGPPPGASAAAGFCERGPPLRWSRPPDREAGGKTRGGVADGHHGDPSQGGPAGSTS